MDTASQREIRSGALAFGHGVTSPAVIPLAPSVRVTVLCQKLDSRFGHKKSPGVHALPFGRRVILVPVAITKTVIQFRRRSWHEPPSCRGRPCSCRNPCQYPKRVHLPSPSAVRGLTRPRRAASGNRGGRNKSCCGPGSSLRKPLNALMYQPVKIFWHYYHSRLSNTWQVFFVPRFQQTFLPDFASEKFRKRAEIFGPLCTISLNSERQKVEFELFRRKSLCILTKNIIRCLRRFRCRCGETGDEGRECIPSVPF